MLCSRILAGYKERDLEVNLKEEKIRKSQLWITQTESQCTLLVFTEIGKGSKQ